MSHTASSRHVPLLSLAPPALALGDRLTLGKPGEEANVGEIWNVITRAADLVQDGQRLENLAWRHWSQPKRTLPSHSSNESLHTPTSEHSITFSRRSFGGSLKLLLEETTFKDWVKAAQLSAPPPETPSANLSIRLVEPTPVPSRVGSLGVSMAQGGLMADVPKQPMLVEEEEDAPARNSKRGKFFVQSSPSKGSGSESSHPSPHTRPRKSSDTKPKKSNDRPPRRNVSLSTMKGKFHAEKRRIAEELAAKEEDGGWEDDEEGTEDEGWLDEDSPVPIWRRKSSTRATPPPPAPTPLRQMSKRERQAAAAERARIEAELDAQQKREMFAKQQIFGRPGPSGLLSGMLKAGGSMVDLSAMRPSQIERRAPPVPSLLRSKSAVAVPVPTGVSVTISSGHRPSSDGSKSSHDKYNDIEMETSDESGDEDDTLNREQTDLKLANIAAKRSQPVSLEDQAKTRRREIIMREMSESLRRNVVLERAKSSTAFKRPPLPEERRTQSGNVLGHGFLRPLTRVAEGEQLPRAQSSANLSHSTSSQGSLAMTRSSTEGKSSSVVNKSRYPDNGYRSHGW